MTRDEWLAEVARRIAINEGCKATRYYDSMGIPTVGIGMNLNRPDAAEALKAAGVKDTSGIYAGTQALTQEQIQALFRYCFAPIESQARASLYPGVYDNLSDARRFVIADLVFNLGDEGWSEFSNTRNLISHAQHLKDAGDPGAHDAFVQAAQHLEASDWFGQVGDRAKRDVAMLKSGDWVDENGDGS